MSWETPEAMYTCNGIIYPLLLDGEMGKKHLVNPWATFAGQGMHAACEYSIELTHIDMLSKDLMLICERCIEEARKVQPNV